MPLLVVTQLFLRLFRYNRLSFKVNMLSILVLRNIEIGDLSLHQYTWKPSLVSTLILGILVVKNDEIGK